jgi:hypothetical protein
MHQIVSSNPDSEACLQGQVRVGLVLNCLFLSMGLLSLASDFELELLI